MLEFISDKTKHTLRAHSHRKPLTVVIHSPPAVCRYSEAAVWDEG